MHTRMYIRSSLYYSAHSSSLCTCTRKYTERAPNIYPTKRQTMTCHRHVQGICIAKHLHQLNTQGFAVLTCTTKKPLAKHIASLFIHSMLAERSTPGGAAAREPQSSSSS